MRDATGARELSAGEELVAKAYGALEEALTAHREDLAPFAERSAVKALAVLGQAANGMDLDPAQLYHIGA